ncbi:MAG TPA: hypothetical protein VGZ52_07445 [Acidimicrobiales bacterium]|jgi:hypothetical protein|nr:hypothetical protein [Acidimicrobiales bacterium]
MLAIAVVFGVGYALARSVRAVWRRIDEAATEHRRAWRVEAVIALDDELLVTLRGGSPEVSRWLHSKMSLPAVVMLARWRHARTPIAILHDDGDTVLRPRPSETGLRFRRQMPMYEVEIVSA